MLLLAAAVVESAPSHHAFHVGNVSGIMDHAHHQHSAADELVMTKQKNSDQSGTDAAHQMVKRSTDLLIEKQNTVTIDWKSLMVILSEIIRKILDYVTNTFKKLLHVFIPFLSTVGHPSVDWRSAATSLFNTLVKFQHLRKNEVW